LSASADARTEALNSHGLARQSEIIDVGAQTGTHTVEPDRLRKVVPPSSLVH